jgi:hypothetical protein
MGCAGCGSATAAERSDDRPAIFAAQAARIRELGEIAEGLVRCGIRSEHWSYKLHISIIVGVQKLSDRLWPESWKDLTYDRPSAAGSTGNIVAPELGEFADWQE